MGPGPCLPQDGTPGSEGRGWRGDPRQPPGSAQHGTTGSGPGRVSPVPQPGPLRSGVPGITGIRHLFLPQHGGRSPSTGIPPLPGLPACSCARGCRARIQMAEYCPRLIRAARGGKAARFPLSPGNQRADDFIKTHCVGGRAGHSSGSRDGIDAGKCPNGTAVPRGAARPPRHGGEMGTEGAALPHCPQCPP